ncbi:MAG TPA: hypothetical protein VLT89_04715 [Usitatibacter sp.]|nr:hypothetical protein [Usitatibacter sp.]
MTESRRDLAARKELLLARSRLHRLELQCHVAQIRVSPIARAARALLAAAKAARVIRGLWREAKEGGSR